MAEDSWVKVSGPEDFNWTVPINESSRIQNVDWKFSSKKVASRESLEFYETIYDLYGCDRILIK